MLRISRKEGESVNIYTKEGVITVYVGQHRNGQTKLGISAPASVQILRDEIDTHTLSDDSKNLSVMLRIRRQLSELVWL